MASENYSEKVSVNINSSTLSSIDLLVDHGYYSNRSDFINQALRSALQQQQTTIDRIIEQHASPAKKTDPWFAGVYCVEKKEIEQAYLTGDSFSIRGYGVLIIDSDCPEDMLFAVVKEIRVKGRVSCSESVKAHYQLK